MKDIDPSAKIGNRRVSNIARVSVAVAALVMAGCESNRPEHVSATPPATNVVADNCNIPAAVAAIVAHTRSASIFRWPVAEASNAPKGFVLIEGKSSITTQPIYDPLLIECGGKITRYVGVTTAPGDTLGTHYTIRKAAAGNTGMYLDVINPAQVVVAKSFLGGGHMVEKDAELREELIHPVSETNLPAFVLQPGLQTLENSFGAMTNDL